VCVVDDDDDDALLMLYARKGKHPHTHRWSDNSLSLYLDFSSGDKPENMA